MMRALIGLACMVALAIAGIAGFGWFLERRQAWEAAPHMVADPASLPEMNVALVLGTGPLTYWRDGRVTPNVPFVFRLDAAAEVWRSGKVKYVIVSGRRDGAYDEPTAMRNGLIKQGVPANAIYPDYGGRRTFDSVLRARAISGVKRIVIVSQREHVERAMYLARSLGTDAWGYAAKDEGAPGFVARLYLIAAALRAWWDVTSTVPPDEAL